MSSADQRRDLDSSVSKKVRFHLSFTFVRALTHGAGRHREQRG
jgi:hypothetical protein